MEPALHQIRKTMKAIYLSAILSTVAAMTSSAVIIDNFDEGGASVSIGALNPGNFQRTAQDNGLNTGNTIGGNREVTAHRTTGAGNTESVLVDVAGVFSFQTGTTAGHGHLWYDGADGIPSSGANTPPPIDFDGLVNADLTTSGANSFHFQAVSKTASAIILEIYKNGATETGKATFTLQLTADVTGYNNVTLTDYYIPFSNFTGSGGWDNLTDFATVGAIKVTLHEASALENSGAYFDNLETSAMPVPEFHHYAMFAGLGCLGFAVVRNRMIKKLA